ncbi:hypothetical protein [Limnoglobus roseus]|uniref:hypothetical protein n=1 Tax=Limnoglobus roseus TaxID=2598579 RepID=UPI0011EB04F3|nr:hypothetical protein [Limnoglobus roseus]
MSKVLKELVERLAVAPTQANRDAFLRGLVMSMIWTPIRTQKEGPPQPMTLGPDGQPALLVYADGSAALREPGVKSAGGGPGRESLERALASGAKLTVTTGHETTAPQAVVTAGEIPAVLALGRAEDPVLGVITWHPSSDDDNGFWEFEAGPVENHSVAGVVVPDAPWESIRPDELSRIRQTVQWVRGNDFAVRSHIAAEMWDWWYNEYCDPPDREEVRTQEEFRDKLSLEVIRFEPGEDGFLDYADHGLVCGYGIRVYVRPDGRFTRGPEIG